LPAFLQLLLTIVSTAYFTVNL